MQQGNLFYILITAGIALIAFFLARFYFMVDEIRQDVKSVLIGNSGRDEKVNNIENKVDDIEVTLKDHGEKLTQLEIELLKKH